MVSVTCVSRVVALHVRRRDLLRSLVDFAIEQRQWQRMQGERSELTSYC